MAAVKLDDIDKRLLNELSENSRQDYAALSRKLRLGRDRIKYRVKKLEQLGVIAGYQTLINPSKVGQSLYKTYFRLNNDKQRITKLIQYLDKHPRTYWVAECYGHWDLIVVFFAETPKDFQETQDQVLGKFNDIVLAFSVYVLIDAWYFSRAYLSGFSIENCFVGGADGSGAVTALDFRILEVLSKNSRAPYAAIAEEVDCAPATARYRIERMEGLGVIAGYRVDLDLPAIGRNFFKSQLYLAEYDPRKEEELRAYCKADLCIVHLLKQIGDCKLELEWEVESFEQYNELLDEMRERFRGYIRNVEMMVIRKQRFTGVPRDMFKQAL